MPTNRPRLTITLTPDIDRALSDFSRLTGQSKSAFIVQVLDEAVPHLTRMAVVIQQAAKLRGDASQAAREKLAKYADTVVHQASGVLKSSDLFLDHAEFAVADGSKRANASVPAATAASSAAAAGRPPSVNKGVGNNGEGVGSVQTGKGRAGGKVVQMRSKP